MAKRIATFRWLAREIAIENGSNWAECPKHWIEKARKAAAAVNVEEMVAALVNFEWMVAGSMTDPKWVSRAERLLEKVSVREFVEEVK